jgi:hypothetical protein
MGRASIMVHSLLVHLDLRPSSRSCAERKEVMCSRQFVFYPEPNNAATVQRYRGCLDAFSARVIGMIFKGFPHVEMC